MRYANDEVLEFIEENDVKFIRLVFCDILGTPKNVAVMASNLPNVLENGSGFDASAVDGFMNISESDLRLFPDASTLAILPWRPQSGRVARMYCQILQHDGSAFAGDGRYLLVQAKKKLEDLGFFIRARFEGEFYLFRLDEKGNPTKTPQDNAGYLDIAPLDKCEDVRRDICLALENLGMSPMGSHHEKGPGQNEVWCGSTDVVTCADDIITYKTVVKTIAAQHGLYASFMPKPIANKSGSGLHLRLSFHTIDDNMPSENTQSIFDNFIAGILEYIPEITFFLNFTTNSYKRFGIFNAPSYVSWGKGNRSQLVRVPFSKTKNLRMELRSPDMMCNPYYAWTLLLNAGIKGIENKIALPNEAKENIENASSENQQEYKKLPQSLEEALQLAKKSELINATIPTPTLEKIFSLKSQECRECIGTTNTDEFEFSNYF